jgi:hypothetical protein
MAQNNMDDVAHYGKSLQTLNEDSGDQLYRYYRFHKFKLIRGKKKLGVAILPWL